MDLIFAILNNLWSQLKWHTRIHTGKKSDAFEVELEEDSLRRFRKGTSEMTVRMKGNAKKKEKSTKKANDTGETLRYKCDSCEKEYVTKGGLKTHILTHTGEKPHKCEYCDKAFVRKNVLIQHIRTHTGERPYQCTFCDKKYKQNNLFIIHMRKHTGETPYKCHLCDKGFRSRISLRRHIRQSYKNWIKSIQPFKMRVQEFFTQSRQRQHKIDNLNRKWTTLAKNR